jgi:hypothetical protein
MSKIFSKTRIPGKFCLPFGLTVLVGIAACTPATSTPPRVEKTQSSMSASSNQEKGRRLHDQLVAIATESKDRTLSEESKVMESALLASIPIGSSFDNAEEILGSAGFEVSPIKVSDPHDPGACMDRLCASLRITQRTHIFFELFENFYVDLFPEVPSQYDRVHKIKAFLDMPMP